MFRLDSPLITFLNKVCDIMILNFLLIICSLPIFTIGASLTAGYYTTYRMVRDEEGYIYKTFFKAFKENFKQSTAIWLVFLALIAFLFVDYRIIFYSGLEVPKWVIYGVFVVTLVVAMGFAFVFPMQARFSNTVKNTIRNSFLMAFTHIPSALVLIVIVVVPFILMYAFTAIIPAILMLSFGLILYVNSFLLLKVFKKYEPQKESEEENGEGIFAVSDAMEKESENKDTKKK